MNFDSIRLLLGCLWLAVAAVFAIRPAGLGDRLDFQNAGLVAATALVLAAWNLSRWYFLRPTPPARPAKLGSRPVRRRDEDRPEEYNPDLDFTKRDR